MHNYFQHQRPKAQDSPEEKERVVSETTRRVKQSFDVFLVLDVEATCLDGGELSTNRATNPTDAQCVYPSGLPLA